MKYPEYIKNCIEMLEASGYSAYAVGGAVRDSLLGKEPSDWDVTTSAEPEETLDVFKNFRTIPTGIKHGTVTVLANDGEKYIPVEITTFRIDGEYRDSRHPESVEFSKDVRDDLSRRDFTVNAIAFNEKEGIIDAFDGQNDLEKCIIRAVGDPEKRFSEDALRILRAFRFASQLEFEIEESTLVAAQKCSYLLKNIARERIGVEFKKLLSCNGVVYSLQKMIEYGVWQNLFDAPPPSAEIISRIAHVKNGNFATHLSALIFELSISEKEEFLTSLRLSNNEKKLVLRLCNIKNFDISQSQNDFSKCARQFLHLYNNIYEEGVEMLAFFNEKEDIDEFLDALNSEKHKNNPISISDLDIKGDDILPLCDKDYSRVGKTLEFLLKCVIEDPTLNRKEKLIEIAKKGLK